MQEASRRRHAAGAGLPTETAMQDASPCRREPARRVSTTASSIAVEARGRSRVADRNLGPLAQLVEQLTLNQ